jgi:hypothetical protein
MDPEAPLLLSYLGAQREHVLGIVDGLSDEDLRRPVLPTGWTCLGLVQHLAVDVEEFWFQEVFAGEPVDPGGLGEGPAAGWQVPDGARTEEVLGRYRRAAARADEIVGASSLDAEPAAWPDTFGSWRLANLRTMLLHVIAETACHAGHLDAARELLDGRTWLRLFE